ncbi:hypothetical protein ACFQ51_02275 [Streptomyces kaempferi]
MRERVAGRTPQERQWFLVSMEFTLHAARNPAVAEQLAVHEDRLTQGLTDVLTRTLARAAPSPSSRLAIWPGCSSPCSRASPPTS